jgi:hypothetical protein
LTAVSNSTLTAAQWNASVRDNLLMTVPAVTTAAGTIFVGTAANTVGQRVVTSDTIDTSETTTSTTFVDITTVGPQVTLTTGVLALIFYAAQMNNSTVGSASLVSWAVSGATSVAAGDATSINIDAAATFQDVRAADVRRATGLTAGSNTFKLQYRVSANTGTFLRRHLVVMGL